MSTRQEKSRHTAISGELSRSFGIEDGQDLVAVFRDDGTITIREEPVTRKLGRGEKLPEVVMNVRETFDAGKKQDTATPKEIESRIDKVLARLPVADLSSAEDAAVHGSKFAYRAKVWLMQELQKEFQ